MARARQHFVRGSLCDRAMGANRSATIVSHGRQSAAFMAYVRLAVCSPCDMLSDRLNKHLLGNNGCLTFAMRCERQMCEGCGLQPDTRSPSIVAQCSNNYSLHTKGAFCAKCVIVLQHCDLCESLIIRLKNVYVGQATVDHCNFFRQCKFRISNGLHYPCLHAISM